MKGIYIMLTSVGRKMKPEIGSIGKVSIEKGLYAYVGSAQNNLEKRVARHMTIARGTKQLPLRWHIDYLLNETSAKVMKVFYKEAGKAEECRIAAELGKTEAAVPKFGCSDCSCNSHLFRVKSMKSISKLGMREL